MDVSSRARFFSGSDLSVLLWVAVDLDSSVEALSPDSASFASLVSSNSSCALFFLGEETCSFISVSLSSPIAGSGVAFLDPAAGVPLSDPLSWATAAPCSEMDVCFSSRRAAVVSASSLATGAMTGSAVSVGFCVGSAMMSEYTVDRGVGDVVVKSRTRVVWPQTG